jgi:hypothetical protein
MYGILTDGEAPRAAALYGLWKNGNNSTCQ